MLPVANAGQGRCDGAGFYHGPGEMTRKMCGIRGQCDILAGTWRGDPATRGAHVLALPISEERFPNVAFRKMMQFLCFATRKMMQISLDKTRRGRVPDRERRRRRAGGGQGVGGQEGSRGVLLRALRGFHVGSGLCVLCGLCVRFRLRALRPFGRRRPAFALITGGRTSATVRMRRRPSPRISICGPGRASRRSRCRRAGMT